MKFQVSKEKDEKWILRNYACGAGKGKKKRSMTLFLFLYESWTQFSSWQREDSHNNNVFILCDRKFYCTVIRDQTLPSPKQRVKRKIFFSLRCVDMYSTVSSRMHRLSGNLIIACAYKFNEPRFIFMFVGSALIKVIRQLSHDCFFRLRIWYFSLIKKFDRLIRKIWGR
jgi:hypothetical protein